MELLLYKYWCGAGKESELPYLPLGKGLVLFLDSISIHT